jgi:hypothetical protein
LLGTGDLVVYDPEELGVGDGARLWGGEGREESGTLGAVGMGLARVDTPATPCREETARRRSPGRAAEGGGDGHRRGSARVPLSQMWWSRGGHSGGIFISPVANL